MRSAVLAVQSHSQDPAAISGKTGDVSPADTSGQGIRRTPNEIFSLEIAGRAGDISLYFLHVAWQ